MFGLGSAELILVLLLAIILIGPKELPQVATQLGKFFHKLRRTAEELKETVERELDGEKKKAPPTDKPADS